MKKKILALALVVVLAVTAVTGATLAYFTDTDEATNTFTSGKVDITLVENFDPETAKLVPGVDINKDVQIKLAEDSEEAWVWYTYAIPAAVDAPDSLEDSINNIVHVNHAGKNWLGFQNNKNYWDEGQTTATPEDQCWIPDYDCKQGVEIGGIEYNVYSVLYNGTLTAGETTTIGMTKVYLDAKVDYADGKYYVGNTEIGMDLDDVQIIVNAYAIQAAGIDTVQEAYATYNTAA